MAGVASDLAVVAAVEDFVEEADALLVERGDSVGGIDGCGVVLGRRGCIGRHLRASGR